MGISCMIADDEPGMRLLLSRILEKVGGFDLVAQAQEGQQTLELFEQFRPQVVFLDVEMPGISGVECARYIQDVCPQTVLIFATAHEGYMREAFEVYAFDYLLKPFSAERALNTLERVRSVLTGRSGLAAEPVQAQRPRGLRKLAVRTREGTSYVDMDDIVLIERSDRQSVILTQNERIATSESLTDIEKRLDGQYFLRCHKSYIINLACVKRVEPYGRWTYVVKLEGIREDALATHEKLQQIESALGAQ
nr:LytTR family DNA-binding domain-containing protein [bacterium]